MIKENSLLIHVTPYKKRFLLALSFMIVYALFSGLFTVVMGPLMQEVFVHASGEEQTTAIIGMPGDTEIRDLILQALHYVHIDIQNLTLFMPWMLLFVFVGQSVFSFLYLFCMKTLGLKVVRNIREQVYSKLVNQSVDFLSKAKTGDLVSRISNDIEKIKFAVSETLSDYVRESMTLIIQLLIIFVMDWYMALISLVILPVAAVPLYYFGKMVKRKGLESQEAIAELSGYLTETVTGNRIVKAYNMETYELEKFSESNKNHYKINTGIALVYSLSGPAMNTIGGIVAFAILTTGISRIADGTLTPERFIVFLIAVFQMYNPIKRLSRANNDYQQGKAGYERVKQIMTTENPIKDSPSAIELPEIKGAVEFQDVTFSYQAEVPVINTVNFTAESNEMIALVGASGSGKSTLISLLLRFYEPESGKILIDGNDILSIKLRSLRDSISLVTQDVFLFNDTVENNIAYGSKNYSLRDIEKAAEIARAADFIEKLPNKYNTVVGERGIFLSTGQRQRLSIARAILKKPAILIFDEATSSLDSESESLIQEAMTEVMKNRTTFVIAHRLSTIIEADKILVIENGDIKESGNHKELLAKKGHYHTLYNHQFPEMGIIM
ncbi:MAG: ABC transporter ATP-binding protein [bacterium]|nr:ABC transporter ATP-binding protein [bacterium]